MAYTTDMTTGSESRHIVRFALPLLAGNLFQQLYNIVDSMIVGRYLNYNALAAVGATGSITFLFYNLCIGLATGAGILISQNYGAKRDHDVKRYVINSAYVLGIFGLVISILSTLAAPLLLRLLDTPDSVFADAVGYMKISCIGTVAVAAYNWISSVMRALGDSKTPLLFLILASILNVGLDLLFVVGFGWGVNGAAWATISAQAVSAVSCILFACRKNPMFCGLGHMAKPSIPAAKHCIRTGVPIALQNALVSVSMIYLQKTANHFGDVVMASYTATMRIEQLVQQPFASLGSAISAFAGQNMGAKKEERAVKGYYQSMKIAMCFAILMLAVFLCFSKSLIGCFVQEPAVVEIGANALKLSACFYCFLGTIHVTRGLLNGAGDVKYALINGIAEVAGRIGFATILVHIPIVSHWAVWTTTCLTWTLTAVMSLIRYRKKAWERSENSLSPA